MSADYLDTSYDDVMHGVKPYESLQKPEIRHGLPAVPIPVRPVLAVPVPVRAVPAVPVPVRSVPALPIPVKSVPAVPVPVRSVPAVPVPVKSVPAGQSEVYRVNIGRDQQNPTYEDIMHDGEKSFESSQKPEIRQGLIVPARPVPAGPVPAGPVPAGPVPEASESKEDTGSKQTHVPLKRYLAVVKRYKAAVVVLSILLILAVITILYLFVGHTHNSQTINNQPQDIPAAAETTTLAALTATTTQGTAKISMTTLTTTTTATTTMSQRIPKDCQGYRDSGLTQSGVYPIQIISHPQSDAVDVYCDMQMDGGGWTSLMKREDGSVRFTNRRWTDYKHGFGDVSGEHWIGNEFMNELTLNNGDLYELRIDLEAFDGEKRFAKHQHFAVANKKANYRLFLGSYSGDAGDGFRWHANMEFTTADRDNDKWPDGNCAVPYTGGWWYNGCLSVKLTGTYGSTDYVKGVIWYNFKGLTESLKYADMKVRPSSVVKKSCKAWKDSGINNNDARNISLGWEDLEPSTILVLCDQGTKGGGWMLILKRIDGETADFNRNWAKYRAGFGQQHREFWFGLEALHKVTSTVVIYELYIGLKAPSNETRYIIYSFFKVTAQSDYYRLVLGPVKEGDLVDSLRGNNGQPFSTRDVDNDNWEQNCAQTNAAGWWYDSCTDALLTGLNYTVVPVEYRLRWKNWLGTGEEIPPIAEATMMIRPVN